MTHSSWHSTDDEVVLPINRRTSDASPSLPLSSPTPLASPATEKMRMGFAALLGISFVLITLSFFFDVTSLVRGSLVPSTSPSIASSEVTVTITPAGVFEPDHLTLSPGKTLLLVNKHPDPQVIKTLSGTSLFPPQVVFTDPVRVTFPTDAIGSSIYYSETLPSTSLLSITLREASSVPTVESLALVQSSSSSAPSSPVASSPAPIIPIPFAEELAPPSSPSLSPSASEHSPVLLAIQSSASSDALLPMQNAPLPRNTYTLATRSKRLTQSPSLASARLASSSKLHSGAPLNAYRPRRVTETGMQTWMMALAGMFAIGMTVRMAKVR